ncbi:MAG TPA: hypothetical protein VEK07_09720 [Polyangiaceae bacterium]|nr:hypothetical protein [Polyangiaceae bacterium]
MLFRACVLAALPLFALQYLTGCGFIGGFSDENTPEGDRCNPYTSHNPCKQGAVCAGYPPSSPDQFQPYVLIPFCPENYCCSVDDSLTITSTNPNCQPGCNGGAAAMCAADRDPGACCYADGGTPATLAGCLALDGLAVDGGPLSSGGSSSTGSSNLAMVDAGDAGSGDVGDATNE